MDMNNVVIMFDFNNLIFRNFFIKDINAHTTNPDYMLWRYNTYNSIYQSLWKHSKVKEVILAVDDRNSWRKSYFSRYKESRKKQRDKSDVNWKDLFSEINKLVSDLKHYMPFKVLKIKSAEADDIIAVLCKILRDNCIVISNDEDYLQLISNRVKVYNPGKKEYITCNNPEEFIHEKIFIGQKKDDIFNIITPNDWGETPETAGKRKPGFGKAAYKKVLQEGPENWLNKTHKNKIYGEIDVKSNLKRNRVLMDFNYIPLTIRDRIIDAYNNYNFPPPSNIYQFFKKYNMRGFLEDFSKVESKLLELY
jgi:5'-3' exonuclease